MAYDFSKLTPTQQRVLTFQGWSRGDRGRKPAEPALRKLVDRGLIVAREVELKRGSSTRTVTEYDVPIDVHIAWCEHCSAIEAANGRPV